MVPPTGRSRAEAGADLGLDRPALLVVSDGGGDPARIRALGLAALSGGAWAFYLREPALAARTLGELARSLTEQGLRVLVADRVDVALASGAFGVQLPEHALPVERVRGWVGAALHLGRSVHDLVGARAAVRGGAEWLLFGQVFPSATKSDRRPVGIEPLPAVAAASTVPVLAIGVFLSIWRFFVALKCLAEAHRFSAWQALGAVLIGFVLLVIPVAILAGIGIGLMGLSALSGGS